MRFALPSSISKTRFSIAYFDFIWLVLSPLFAFWLRGDHLLEINEFSVLNPICEYILLTIIFGLPIFVFFRINNGVAHLCTLSDIFSVFSAVSVSVLVSSYVAFAISRLDGIPRSVPFLYGFILFLGLVGYRVAVRSYCEQKIIRQEQVSNPEASTVIRRIILVGLDQFSINTIKLLDSQRPRTSQVVAVISLNGRYSGKTISGVKIIGDLSDLGMIIDEYDIHGVKIDEVWVSDNINSSFEEVLDLFSGSCNERGIELRRLEEALNLTPAMHANDKVVWDFGAENILQDKKKYLRVKRLLDIICSTLLCFLLFIPFIFICLLTLYEKGSPIFFWQERVGLRGRKFLLYKIRTLELPLNAAGRVLDDHERVSKIGTLIRRFRMDEIPQLLSILVGDMSGIGPRPLLPRDQPKESRERLLMRPGLTGWAQVNGGEILTVKEKNALDCWYVNHLSFELDVRIVYKTILVIIYGVRRNEQEVKMAMNWYMGREDKSV